MRPSEIKIGDATSKIVKPEYVASEARERVLSGTFMEWILSI